MPIREILEPSSCRWCGIPKREHFQQWSRTASWHTWVQPEQNQILDRMKARRKQPAAAVWRWTRNYG